MAPESLAHVRRISWLSAWVALAGCGDYRPPPPHIAFGRLPVSGSLADAHFAGFRRCIPDTTRMRCRRDGVTLLGRGPFNAAVDLAEGDGSGGFDELTLWHDRDRSALVALGTALERGGWKACFTGRGHYGDQAVYSRPGAPVRFSMDISYWGKRRFRVIPAWKGREGAC